MKIIPLKINRPVVDVVYGISRWTNASRSSARHLDDGTGMPLCGSARSAYWQKDKDVVSCAKCLRKLLRG